MWTVAHQRGIVQTIAASVAVPPVAELLLPPEREDPDKKDEFGFVVLEDGSVGPFYVCLGQTLRRLHERARKAAIRGASPVELAMELGDSDLGASALSLGAYNALSQFVMRRAGFDPTALPGPPLPPPEAGVIGLVGFFRPLIEQFLACGLRVVVIEKRPERVPAELEVEVHTRPEALAACDYVICTASTLINDTLNEILSAVRPATRVHLLGPSASGLPDHLFSHGVWAVGGLVIDDPVALKACLLRDEAWGKSGHKYDLASDTYPGLGALLERARG